MHRSKILAFGHDTTLLQTRELILQHDGFDVVTASEYAEASRILSEQPVDLVLLCHTVREAERQSMLSLAHAVRPDAQVLVLVRASFDNLTQGHDATLCTVGNPRTLLAAVHELTCHSLEFLHAS
jgi:DNA-binding response OmpR family regulator